MSEPLDLNQLAQNIKQWGLELGFQQVGIADTDLSEAEPKLQAGWINNTTARWTGWPVTA